MTAEDLEAFVEYDDFRNYARDRLAPAVFDHLDAGAGTNWTRDENRRAYDRFVIRKRLMVNVADTDLSVTVLIHKDRGLTTALQERAEAAGYKAICLTVDAPNYGIKPADKRNHIHLPSDVRIANLEDRLTLPNLTKGEDLMAYLWREMAQDVTWDDARWLVERSKLPVVAKGVMSAAEARNAASAGCAAVIVSNQGGRQIDGEPATLDLLGEVVEAVGDRVDVLVDGGVRNGAHVFKALALGARCVLIGRAQYWGLAAGGQAGVAKILALLRDKLENTMQLAGVKDLAGITRANVGPAAHWSGPSAM